MSSELKQWILYKLSTSEVDWDTPVADCKSYLESLFPHMQEKLSWLSHIGISKLAGCPQDFKLASLLMRRQVSVTFLCFLAAMETQEMLDFLAACDEAISKDAEKLRLLYGFSPKCSGKFSDSRSNILEQSE